MDEHTFLIGHVTAADAGGRPKKRIELMPTGTYTMGGSTFTLTVADLELFAADLNERDVSIDYDHSFAQGGGSLAAGWFVKGTAKVEGERLTVDVNWTADGARDIAEGKYRFISPEWASQVRDKASGKWKPAHRMLAAGLTNRPFFTQLAPLVEEDALVLAASERGIADLLKTEPETSEEPNVGAADTKEKESQMKGLAEVYGLKADASEDEILAAAQAAVQENTELKTKVETLEESQVDPATIEQLTASAAKGEQAHKELHDERRETLLAQAVRDGKILPTQKDAYATLYDLDPVKVATDIAAMAASAFPTTPQGSNVAVDLGGEQVTGTRMKATVNGSDYEADDASVSLDAATRKILADQGKHSFTEEEYLAAAEVAISTLGIER